MWVTRACRLQLLLGWLRPSPSVEHNVVVAREPGDVVGMEVNKSFKEVGTDIL